MKKDEHKDLKLQEAINQLNKKYKKDVITTGIASIEKVSTGMISLDKLMGGGFAKGKWSMVFGDRGTCKTSICKQMAGKIIKQGGKVAVVDAEHSWDPEYAKTLGLDADKLIYNRPDTLEEGATIIQKLAPVVNLLIYDSIVAVAPEAEINREVEQETRAIIPRKLSQVFRMVTPIIGKSKAVIILVNQVRIDLNKYGMKSFSGGNALKHGCSFIMQLWRGSKADAPSKKVNGKEIPIGFKIFAKAAKSKISDTEGQTVSFNYFYKGEHFKIYDDITQMGILINIIKREGSWYKYDSIKTQGLNSFIEELSSNKNLYEKLKKDIMRNND